MDAREMNGPMRGKIPLLLILSAAAVGIFLVPWYVPVTEPAMGQSYTYGFNNNVAILAVGLTLVLLFIYLLCHWRGMQGSRMEQAIIQALSMRPEARGSRRLAFSFPGASVLFSILIAGCYWYVPFDHFGEMHYFLVRINLLVLHRAPYYDFPFAYGPAMLSIPFQLYKVAAGHLSLEQAYCVVLIIHWILGLWLLAWCVRLLFPAPRQTIVFWVFALTFLNFTLGCSYAPLRFVLPIAGVLLSHYAVLNFQHDRFRGHLLVGLTAFLGSFLNFESSPEMGLAATAALLIYFAGLLRTPQRAFAHGAVMALAGALAAILPWSTAYLSVLSSYGGSLSIPVFPGLGMLLFLAAAFFLLPRLAVIGVRSREPSGPACLALCILTGVLIVPALSRCDIGHVFLNGLGIYLIVLAALARLPDPRRFKGALAVFFFVFAILGNWLFLFHYSKSFKEAIVARSWMRSHPMPACAPASNGFLFSKQYPPLDGLDPLLAYGDLAAPLGCTDDVEQFLLLHGHYETGYNPANCSDVWMLKQTVRPLRDLETFRTILVPKSYFVPGPSAGDELLAMDYRFLRNQTLCPVRLVPRRPFFDPERLLASHISQEFSVVGQFRDYLIMANRAAKPQ